MNPKIVRDIIYPLHEFSFKRETFSILKEIEKTQWLSSSEIKEMQWLKLKKLLQHAAKTVPYYKDLFEKNNCMPHSLYSYEDFKYVPILTKEIIRKNNRELISESPYKKFLVPGSTTGTSGEPLDYFICQNRIAYNNAFEIRSRRWIGLDNFDKKIWLWGRRRKQARVVKILKSVRDYSLNKKLFLCDFMDEQVILNFFNLVKRFRPKFLYCYANAIYHIAQYIKDNNIDGSAFEIEGIITTAEVLYEHQRKIISDAFKCRVAVEYGSSDGGLTAQECEYGNLHINSEGILLEISENQDNDYGEILITNLNSYSMPFIRYKIGDIGELSEKSCQCGRNLPILNKIIGRTMDGLWTKNGGRVDSLVIDTIAEEHGILKFKIHQTSYEEILLKLVVNSNYTKKFEKWFKNELENLFGYPLVIKFVYKNNLPIKPGEKHRYITTDVKSPFNT